MYGATRRAERTDELLGFGSPATMNGKKKRSPRNSGRTKNWAGTGGSLPGAEGIGVAGRRRREGGRGWVLAWRGDATGEEEKRREEAGGGGRSRSPARPTQRRTTTRWPDRDAAPINNAEHRCAALHRQLSSVGLVG
jgi:hypothetical protein